MKELIGAYWDIAYKEGSTGVSHGSEAQEVLSKINDALERMVADEKRHCAMIDALKGDKQFLDAKCERLTTEKSGPYFGHYQSALGRIAVLEGNVKCLTAERDALREGLDAYKVSLQAAKAEVMRLIAERDALRADAELKYTAWQSPHNDDLWLENPADCEIIDNFHPPVHVGFEYELTAGSYTTQRYRVVKIADAESDDVLVELIAGEKT